MASLGEFTDIQSVSLEIYGDQRAWIEVIFPHSRVLFVCCPRPI